MKIELVGLGSTLNWLQFRSESRVIPERESLSRVARASSMGESSIAYLDPVSKL